MVEAATSGQAQADGPVFGPWMAAHSSSSSSSSRLALVRHTRCRLTAISSSNSSTFTTSTPTITITTITTTHSSSSNNNNSSSSNNNNNNKAAASTGAKASMRERLVAAIEPAGPLGPVLDRSRQNQGVGMLARGPWDDTTQPRRTLRIFSSRPP